MVPNLPFFYLVYRAWSHWKGKPPTTPLAATHSTSTHSFTSPSNLTAYKSSQYLSTLISQDRVHPTESKVLDAIFSQASPPLDTTSSESSPAKPAEATPAEDERMLLLKHHIPMLMDKMEFPEWVKADLRRARLQVEKSVAENKLDELESSAEEVHPEKKK